MAYTFLDLRNDMDEFLASATALQAFFATMATERDSLAGQLHTTGVKDLYGPAYEIYERAKRNLEATQTELVALFHRRILDRTETQIELPQLYDGTLDEALFAIYDDMEANLTVIAANAVACTTPSKTAVGTNAGNLYVTNYLPGNIAPGDGLRNYYGWQGEANEMAEADSVVCLTRDGVNAIVSGRPPRTVPYGGETTFGNRGYALVPCDGSGNLISNFFEDFTSDVPDSWTLDTGTATTTCAASTAQVVRGTNSLWLTGANQLSYPVATLVESRQNLLLSIWARKHASTVAGTYTIRMTGTGMTTQTATWNATDLSSAAWTEKTLHLEVPAVIPSDLQIEIVTASVSASGIYIDTGHFQPYIYWAGFGWAITLGADDFVAGDKWTATISNDYASARQTWMVRSCGFQLNTTS
jgi:hypothetical protein